jgi:hypothetical protein
MCMRSPRECDILYEIGERRKAISLLAFKDYESDGVDALS